MKKALTALLSLSLIFSGAVIVEAKTTHKTTKTSKKSAKTTKQSCGSKRTCGEMNNCSEAKHYLNVCGVSRLDRDNDGVPCESICR